MKQILAMHKTAFVYAGVRSLESAIDLEKLKVRYADRIAIVKCVSGDSEGNAALAKRNRGAPRPC